MALILGIKGGKGLHNSSIAILDTEKNDILFVGEEERFYGGKHTDCFPIGSISYCLDRLNIKTKDIEYIAIGNNESEILSGYWDIFNNLSINTPEYFKTVKESCFEHSFNMAMIKKKLIEMFPDATILNINHHDTHAALAFYCSTFEESVIFTSDGLGEAESMTFSYGKEYKIQRLHSITYPNSLGFMYTLFCNALGFFGPNPEGKIMALASFGKPRFLNSFKKLYFKNRAFGFELNYKFMGIPIEGGPPVFQNPEIYKQLFTIPYKCDDEELNQTHFDIAASLQLFFEETIVSLATDLYNETKCRNICVGGGSFLNSVVNNKILELTQFEKISINPASHDGGNALGAALYVKHHILKCQTKTEFKNAYHGYEITETESIKVLNKLKIQYTQPKNLIKDVAQLLHDGALVGWTNGKAEIGPRALCNRSILVNPTKKETINYLNDEIKHREWFRPYAPVVMEEYANLYFEFKNSEVDSPYMLKVHNIKKEAINKIPAISHVDGTARTQTISLQQNEDIYNLLKEYSKLSGIHVLLNTSFNIGGESIVNNEYDSIMCFMMAKLDYLVLDKFLISRQDNKELIDEFLKQTTFDNYFFNRKNVYVNKFRNFIIDTKNIFSSTLTSVNTSRGITFKENKIK